ncbi:hypothetical protein C7121_11215 [Paenibacillus glucanolyticus]|jgi:hypothetical protein|uniref:Uncharacterized protein n=1 Tax=Paenibacillus lautus TaxID=1401 RepID=A0A2A5LFQ3_PAELA|nr:MULTISPECIES: hypothetical protein [Paenibacillus]MBY0162999.1 hypothetical protein [Cytobacillus firmus]RKM04542.1 hypothetical protein D6D84_09920 [Moraxella catarrhalis]VTR62688.1 Uncharacterised protein [Actinobacillus pleuropneumoniae]ACX67698.1 conserved hypothetical protein [Paenibacillus sp. Y412MC10]AVV56641.1 hypothetical protein C7121_11215 [Paenibacillus glucanolyticus]
MIPFSNTWPYDVVGNDVYVHSCPFCGTDNVLLPMKPKELVSVREGKKKLLIFPCCHNKVTVLDSDIDYLLTDQRLR